MVVLSVYQSDCLRILSERRVTFLVLGEDESDESILLWVEDAAEFIDAIDKARARWRHDFISGKDADIAAPPDVLVGFPDGDTLRLRGVPSPLQKAPPNGSIYAIAGEIDPTTPFRATYDRSHTSNVGSTSVHVIAELDMAKIRAALASQNA